MQEEGLPLGSVLSVTLFAIVINEITKQLGSEVHSTLYVDDFTILVSAATITHSIGIIQIAINNLEQWTKTTGMRFSIEKTVAIKFEKRKKGEEPQLTLHGSRVQVRESTRYLGLIIDKRLNWKDHVDHLRAICTSSVNPLGFHPYSARETPQLPGLSASGIFRAKTFFVVPYLRYL